MLFAQISMDLTRREATLAVAPLLERWTWFLEGNLSIAIHRSNPELRPKVEKAKGKGFAHGKRWKTLLEELATESVVEVSAGRWPASPDEVFDGGVGSGFVFGTRIGQRAKDGSMPTLAFWLDTRKFSEERGEAARKFLESAMDMLMAEHRGLQAVVTWTSPVGPPTLDMTDYEQIAGSKAAKSRCDAPGSRGGSV